MFKPVVMHIAVGGQTEVKKPGLIKYDFNDGPSNIDHPPSIFFRNQFEATWFSSCQVD